ncbi:MAG TPA: hypothetical protein O0X27_02050 [Methanocorpusculum sp.]|nr:hypothetical protein [Methanocorpusculum sp.]
MNSKKLVFAGLIAALLLICAVAPVSAAEPSTLKLTDATYPEIMNPGEEGTLYVTLTNTGKDTVVLNDIYLKYYGDDDGLVSTMTDWRNLPTRILAGETLKNIPVPIKAGNKTGTFYATICVDSNYGYVYDSKYPIVIKVMENTPELQLSNFQVTKTGDYYTLKADVNNLGFATANALTISSLEGGDVGPYATYPIGNLDEDDLAGFTLTFKMPENGILTIVTDYKDTNRNHVIDTYKLNVSNHINVEETNPAPAIITTIIVILIIVLIVVAVVRKSKKSKRH